MIGSSTYADTGVSADKKDVREVVEKLSPGLFPGAFCKIMPDLFDQSNDHCLIQHSDGVGTKTLIAYLMYREGKGAKYFHNLAIDSLVMNTDDMAAVGCVGPFIMNNVINRNAKLIDGEVISQIILGYADFCAEMEKLGIGIHEAGGETADSGDNVRTLVLDSTLCARMKREEVIDCSQVKPNQDIVGFASFGQATYETSYNSGIGTNGFTCVRHALLSSRYKDAYPETYAPEIAQHSYKGKFELDAAVPGCDLSLGEALLSSTRTYLPIIKTIPVAVKKQISAIYHNTGGGLTKCLSFGSGVSYVKDALFDLPPLFQFIKAHAGLPNRELCRVFNLGQRLELVCDKSVTQTIIDIASQFNVSAKVIGRTVPCQKQSESLTIVMDGEELRYDRNKRDLEQSVAISANPRVANPSVDK
ncbi:MAG: AIR synthase related protein [Pseudomonadota bacterium]